MVKVFGHKSPDTDAVCAAISYAWLLKQVGQESEAFVLGDLNRETEFVLKTAGVNKPKLLGKLVEGDEIAIVDTNNPDELPEDISMAHIKNIIDHHKLSGLSTDSPIEVYMKPVGCTSTLIYQVMAQKKVVPTREIAGLMLSAILSDTLKFTSPTTTEEDREAVARLNKLAEVDIESHAEKMFDAKSDLTGMSASDVLLVDSKVYEFGDKKVRISVLETIKPENTKQMIDKLREEMENLKSKDKLDFAFFFVIDILKNGAELIVSGDSERDIAKKAFEKDFEGDYLNLPGVVSRKKQIAPVFEKVIS